MSVVYHVDGALYYRPPADVITNYEELMMTSNKSAA
jgi:hypothetical protein